MTWKIQSFELAKMSSIFGHAFIYVYQDENMQTRATYNSPINMFIVHDNSIEERPLFAVRYTFNENSQKVLDKSSRMMR